MLQKSRALAEGKRGANDGELAAVSMAALRQNYKKSITGVQNNTIMAFGYNGNTPEDIVRFYVYVIRIGRRQTQSKPSRVCCGQNKKIKTPQ